MNEKIGGSVLDCSVSLPFSSLLSRRSCFHHRPSAPQYPSSFFVPQLVILPASHFRTSDLLTNSTRYTEKLSYLRLLRFPSSDLFH